MTTTARTTTRRIATATAALSEWIVISGYDVCDLCPRTAGYLFPRLTEDGDEVHACETCVDHHGLGYVAD